MYIKGVRIITKTVQKEKHLQTIKTLQVFLRSGTQD